MLELNPLALVVRPVMLELVSEPALPLAVSQPACPQGPVAAVRHPAARSPRIPAAAGGGAAALGGAGGVTGAGTGDAGFRAIGG